MADRIKGITVEIGGDTTGLSKALSGVNKEIKNTQSQLKDVNKLLKLDPTNTTLLEQKQKAAACAVYGRTDGDGKQHPPLFLQLLGLRDPLYSDKLHEQTNRDGRILFH